MKKRWFGLAVLISGAVILAVLIAGCASTGSGRPGRARENWNPDVTGNLQITNTSGKDADIFVNDVYARTVQKGKSSFLINVADADNPIGTEIIVKAYDNETKKSLDSPDETALMTTFAVALFPASDADRRMNIQLPPPEYRDKDAAAAGSSQVLVRFEYPLEDIALGSVRATVFEGQITSRRPFVVMNPQIKPIYVPMDVGFKQLSVLYTVATNNRVQSFYYPDWNDAAVDSSIRAFNTADLNPTYTILPVDQIGQVTWTYPKDSQGSIVVSNKSTRPVQLEAASLEPGGKRGLLEQVAVGAAPGSSALEVSPLSAEFRLLPGRYQLSAKVALRNTTASAVEADIEAGTRYYWIITDGNSSLEKDKSVTAATNIDRLVQNWKITSNVPGARVSLGVESTEASVLGFRDHELGNTDNSGALGGKFSIANLISNLTYENAAKVLIKITVSKAGYVPVSQAINALTLMELGSDFVPARFELPEEANKTTPGATYTISGVPFYYGE
ncbi:MAG: hypothetical protein LBQ88_11640 [Treponema sp.]|nr:hypothetical protein [Treponema sp.]